MDKEFIPCELAMALKELGFDEPCFGYYSSIEVGTLRISNSINHNGTNYTGIESSYLAPLYQQAFRWFRDKGFGINIYSKDSKNKDWYFMIERPVGGRDSADNVLKSCEEAEFECLKKLIEIKKRGKN